MSEYPSFVYAEICDVDFTSYSTTGAATVCDSDSLPRKDAICALTEDVAIDYLEDYEALCGSYDVCCRETHAEFE